MDAETPLAPDVLKRVSDVMIPLARYPSVGPDDPLRHAVDVIEGWQLDNAGRRSLPRVLLVLENGGELVGIVRRRDIMRGLEPRFLVSQRMEYQKKFFDIAVDPNLSELPFDRVVKGVRSQADRPVREVMRSVGATIDPDDHLMKAIYEMVSLNLSLLPVVDGGRVLGVIRSVDVFHELAKLLG
ncbi:MAG: CBS domain-containing protein [Gemmatimonadota bacterium]|jgi:CBS domain-containing protein